VSECFPPVVWVGRGGLLMFVEQSGPPTHVLEHAVWCCFLWVCFPRVSAPSPRYFFFIFRFIFCSCYGRVPLKACGCWCFFGGWGLCFTQPHPWLIADVNFGWDSFGLCGFLCQLLSLVGVCVGRWVLFFLLAFRAVGYVFWV